MIPGQPIYSATKAAVQAIAESLYFQMMPYPVNVSALFPGPHVVDTGIFNSGRNRPEELAGRSDQPDSGISSLEDMENMMKSFGMELRPLTLMKWRSLPCRVSVRTSSGSAR